jgi:hypothetical protein
MYDYENNQVHRHVRVQSTDVTEGESLEL